MASTSRRIQRSPEDAGRRLTDQTLSVLAAIAADPGQCNTALAADAGIKAKGQISRLLSRLARLELIENTGGGQAMGAANAWRLTPRGRDAYQRRVSRREAGR